MKKSRWNVMVMHSIPRTKDQSQFFSDRKCLQCQNHDNSTCLNGGRCIPDEDQLLSNTKFKWQYKRDRCKVFDTRLVISITKDILLSQLVYIYFMYKLIQIQQLVQHSVYLIVVRILLNYSIRCFFKDLSFVESKIIICHVRIFYSIFHVFKMTKIAQRRIGLFMSTVFV